MVYWPKEDSVTTVPLKCIVTPSEAGALEVGTLCTVKTYGKVHEGKIAGRGENTPVTHRQPVTHA